MQWILSLNINTNKAHDGAEVAHLPLINALKSWILDPTYMNYRTGALQAGCCIIGCAEPRMDVKLGFQSAGCIGFRWWLS